MQLFKPKPQVPPEVMAQMSQPQLPPIKQSDVPVPPPQYKTEQPQEIDIEGIISAFANEMDKLHSEIADLKRESLELNLANKKLLLDIKELMLEVPEQEEPKKK